MQASASKEMMLIAPYSAVHHRVVGVVWPRGSAIHMTPILKTKRSQSCVVLQFLFVERKASMLSPGTVVKSLSLLLLLSPGVHVRSAATLGGHFALCARKPLPTDLGLLLAAAGAHIQIMTVRPAEGSGKGSSSNQQQWQRWQHQQQCYGVWQQQQRPQRQQYDLHWVSVEDYLEASCIGSNGCRQECSNNNALEITADSIAGGNVLYEDSQPRQSGSCAPSSSSGNGHITACGTEATPLPHVITAVWLPYGDDSSERLWSYKLAVRHVNSHALVNAALWIKFDQQPAVSTTPGSSSAGGNNSSCGCEPGQLLESQTDPRFAGVRVASARLFVGLPPGTADGTSAAASEVSSSSGRGPKYQADEPWCMSRVREVESVLCGRAVDVKVGWLMRKHAHPGPWYVTPSG